MDGSPPCERYTPTKGVDFSFRPGATHLHNLPFLQPVSLQPPTYTTYTFTTQMYNLHITTYLYNLNIYNTPF